MTVIFVQAGQCGNQLGYTVIDGLYDLVGASSDTEIDRNFDVFFRTASNRRVFARAVCFDTEFKVIDECVNRAKRGRRWGYHPSSIANMHGGAGNNWALGYKMSSGTFLEKASDCIRSELEQSDSPPTLAILHGLGGGTGSGLGTRITELCQEEFSDVTRLNISITPYHFGEVVVQHYNALLSLSMVSQSSDAVLLFENEIAQVLCKQMKGIERPNLQDINSIIAANVIPTLLPKCMKDNYGSVISNISDDIGFLCGHPYYKFLNVKCTPQTSKESIDYTHDNWNSLLTTLSKMQIRGTPSERGLGRLSLERMIGVAMTSRCEDHDGDEVSYQGTDTSIASVISLHGPDAYDAAATIETKCLISSHTNKKAQSSSHTSPHYMNTGTASSSNTPACKYTGKYTALADDCVQVGHSPYTVSGYQRSAAVLDNGTVVLPLLQRVASKAADLFSRQAYVHHFHRCGLENDDFVEAFRNVGQVVNDYRCLL